MPQNPVKILTSTNQVFHCLRELRKTVHDEMAKQASWHYQRRGCRDYHGLEDWLREREALSPHASPPTPDAKNAKAGRSLSPGATLLHQEEQNA